MNFWLYTTPRSDILMMLVRPEARGGRNVFPQLIHRFQPATMPFRSIWWRDHFGASWGALAPHRNDFLGLGTYDNGGGPLFNMTALALRTAAGLRRCRYQMAPARHTENTPPTASAQPRNCLRL